jgi:hypothetical protein
MGGRPILASVRWERGTVVAEIESPFVPVHVVGHHVAGRIHVIPPIPQRKCEPASANGPTLALQPGGHREELTPEEVGPQIPLSGDTQKPLANGHKGRRL